MEKYGSMRSRVYLWLFSAWNSPRQLAIAKWFAKANSVFIEITSAIILLRWLFSRKICIQFTIFNTYFSTKSLSTNKRYHLHVLEKCPYVLSQIYYIFSPANSSPFSYSFFHPIFFRSRKDATESRIHAKMFSSVWSCLEKKKPKFWCTKVLMYALDNIRIILVILWLC